MSFTHESDLKYLEETVKAGYIDTICCTTALRQLSNFKQDFLVVREDLGGT